jgi:hypothetical protein
MSSAKAKPRPWKLTAPVVREHPMQRQCTDMLRLEVAREGHVSRDGVVWFSIDQANFASVPGTRVARGICAGVPDVVVLYRGAAYFIELKSDDGVLSDAQRELCTALLWAQCYVGVARSADDVLGLLDIWEIPRNRRVRVAA